MDNPKWQFGPFMLVFMISCSWLWTMSNILSWDHRGRDRMVVGFTTTCAIRAYHHESCEFEPRSGEVYSIRHHV